MESSRVYLTVLSLAIEANWLIKQTYNRITTQLCVRKTNIVLSFNLFIITIVFLLFYIY